MSHVIKSCAPGLEVPPTPRKLRLSWRTIFNGVDALADMVRIGNPNLIIGVSRGGLIPATLLSHKLGIPLRTVSVSAYEGTRRTVEKPVVVDGWDNRYDSNRTLIVDDILDSGMTLTVLRGLSLNAQYAVLVTKQPESYCAMNYFARVLKDTWVVFPWEQGA